MWSAPGVISLSGCTDRCLRPCTPAAPGRQWRAPSPPPAAEGGDHRLHPAIRSCTLDLDDPVILAERYEVEENSVQAALPGALKRSLKTTFRFLPERNGTSSES